MNTKQTAAVNAHLKGRAWEFYGKRTGAYWIVSGVLSFYFFFNDSNEIVKVLID